MNNRQSSKSIILMGVAALIIGLSTLSSCTKTDNTYGMSSNNGNKGGPGTNEVWIQGMAFSPSTITVTAGTTITWTNKDAVPHTVTSDTNLFDSGSIGTNGTFSYTFSTAGSYSYHCAIHTYMKATVIVN